MRFDIKKATHILKSGGVVIFPTDTVYGIGCRADDKKAVDRIYKIKGTPKTQPFPVLVSGIDQVTKLANVNKTAEELTKKYWPGGLTVILKTKDGKPKIGFRQPELSTVQTLTEQVGPIIGTSANFHGNPTPRSYEDLDPDFIKLADFVIKGECKGGVESTVIDATVTPPKILRQGAVTLRKHLRGGFTQKVHPEGL